MSREKQIEEMAKILCGMKNGCEGCMWDKVHCNERNYAEEIYNAGFRKVKKGSWKVIKPFRGEPSYICSVCGALYNEDVREWKGCPKCLSEMKGGAE